MQTYRLLIVDDEPSVRMTLAANLELEGFEILEAESAEQALDLLSRESVDLVFSDIRMPGTGGIGLLQALRDSGSTVPVVLMTAFTDEQRIKDALERGVFTVLAKPFDIDQAIGTLVRALQHPSILVVDDEESEAKTLAAAFESVALRASYTCSANEALTEMDRIPVDVCITDLVMPDVDGAALAASIKQRGRPVAVVVFSGHDVPDMMRKAAAEGAVACLRKPVSPGELIRTVAEVRADPALGWTDAEGEAVGDG